MSQPSAVLGDLEDAVKSVRHISERSDSGAQNLVTRLFAAAEAARVAGFDEQVNDLVESAREGASEAARAVLTQAYLMENDREFRDHGVRGLDIRRASFVGESVTLDDLGIACVATSAGSFVPRLLWPAERALVTIACEMQVFVENNLSEDKAAVLHQRGFDFSKLFGSLNLTYGLRVIRRIAWGSGMCLLTDQRVIGVLFDDAVQEVADSPERVAMPYALVASDGGSIIVFSCERAVFEDHEFTTGFLQNRIPSVNLNGACSVALDTYRVLDNRDLLVRPPKNAIADAVREFIGTKVSPGVEAHPGAPPTSACPTCQRPLVLDDRFCRGCGTPVPVIAPVPTTSICGSCHIDLVPGDRFCTGCGAPVPA